MRTTEKFLLLGILFFAAFLRLYGIYWDGGFHLHPDERAIVLAVVELSYPQSLQEFLSPDSPWNTQFFAYGSLPFYLLRIVGDLTGMILGPLYANYDGITLVGRVLSALFDIGTVVVIFLVGRKILTTAVGLLAAFLYTISVLPIQLSHFYAVDTPLTFFVLLTLYFLIRFYEAPRTLNAVLIGIFFGAALATKISASVLLAGVSAAVVLDFLLILLRQPHRPNIWLPHLTKTLKRFLIHAVLIVLVTIVTFAFFNPYAFIDASSFWQQTLEQSSMTKSAFTFPYTLQYVDKTPYLYEVKNMFLWGLGPILATFSFAGIAVTVLMVVKKDKAYPWAQETILLAFFFAYFLIVGKFAIGFMRYMLPLYPLLCLFAAILLSKLHVSVRSFPKPILSVVYAALLLLFLIWPLSFMQIYTRPHSRVAASEYLNTIAPGKTFAVEHWDDSLPLWGQSDYQMLTLPLYDPDTEEKWRDIRSQLEQTDYIILSSNRLYTPLMKLTDCNNLPPYRCYPATAKYYEDLFSSRLGFTKVAEFTSYPTIPLLNIPIPDQSADESFTVYDHPRVLIFKKDPQ